MLRICFLSEEDLRKNRQILDYRAESYLLPISRHNEKLVTRFLLENLQRHLTGVPTANQQMNMLMENEQGLVRRCIQKLKEEYAGS